jgi:hypothetical protein
MPITALTILISTIATTLSWMFVTKRLRENPNAKTYQTRLMAVSFFYSMLYGICMLLPVGLLLIRLRHCSRLSLSEFFADDPSDVFCRAIDE